MILELLLQYVMYCLLLHFKDVVLGTQHP